MTAAVEGNEANFDVSGRVKDKDGVDIVNFNEPCFSMPSFSIGLTQMAAAESESCLGTTREEATIPTDIDAPSFKIGLTQLETESLSDGNANVLVASVDISKTSVHEGGIDTDPSIGLVPIVGADDVDCEPEDYIPIARRLIKRSRKKAIKLGPPGEASTKPLVKPSVGKPQPATEKFKGVKRKNQLTGGSPKRSNHLRPLIGGFNPFGLPKANRSRCFLKDMQRARLYKVCNGCEIENTGFREIFESQKLLNERGADVLVKFIQKRRDKIRNIRYDFIPASFLSELKRQYNRFCAAKDKEKFFFSSLSRLQLTTRPKWVAEVDLLYCPMKIESLHWLGIVIDFRTWTLTVLDSNTACISDEQLQNYLRYIANMLPFLIKKHGTPASMQTVTTAPMIIQRADLPLCEESLGLAAIASIVLLELHAIGHIEMSVLLCEEVLRTAAQNYAIEAFAAFNPLNIED